MSDLIDRQAAIVQACKQIKDNYVAFDVKEALKGLPSAQQWTPVQQNPERSGWYIVTKRFGNGETWIGTKWYSTAYGWNGDGIIAWMPLPEAYREEKDE